MPLAVFVVEPHGSRCRETAAAAAADGTVEE